MTDLTTGKPSKVIFNFSLPLLLSTALQQVYNIADSVIVGQFAGSTGLAAIGAAYPITLFFIAVATGGSMGCSVVISQLFGAKDMKRMKTAVFTSIIALGAIGITMALLGVALSGFIMRLINTSSEYYADAVSYLRIYSIGVIPMLVYNAANAIFTGLGDSKRPLYFLILSSFLNIILDFIAVGPLKMGVAGAAWATAFSQAVAAALALFFVLKKLKTVETDGAPQVFNAKMLMKMCRIGLPAIFQQASVAFAHTIVQGIVNGFDTAVVAGYEISNKINTVIYSSLNTLGTALSSYVAQCYGAKNFRRIKDGFKASYLMCLAMTAVIVAAANIFAADIIGIFVRGGDKDVIAVGVDYIRIITPCYLAITIIISTGGLLRGLGRSMTFFIETLIEFTVRVSMCFVLVDILNHYTGVMYAWYFGSGVGAALCIYLCVKTMRRDIIPNIKS